MAVGGIDFLLKIGDGAGSEAFTTIGGLRSKSLTFNAEAIDVTNHGSSEYRQILDGKGIRSMSVSGSGVFVDDATAARLRSQCMANSITNFELIEDVSGDKFSGAFKIVSFEYAGEYNGEMTYSTSLESSGTITFTAA